jgi:hypothetical protein
VSQYLAAGAIDELRLHVAPLTLGQGERIFDGVGPLTLEPLGEVTGTDLVTHLRYRDRARAALISSGTGSRTVSCSIIVSMTWTVVW